MHSPQRPLPANTLVHVVNRGNNRQRLFDSDYEYLAFLKLVDRYKEKYSVHLYHYAIMPNHIHLLIDSTNIAGVSAFMQRVSQMYAQVFNRLHATIGHAWAGRFQATLIEDDAQYVACARYIELNPVKAGLVHQPADYRWSSYTAHAGICQEKRLEKTGLLDQLQDFYIDSRSAPAINHRMPRRSRQSDTAAERQ